MTPEAFEQHLNTKKKSYGWILASCFDEISQCDKNKFLAEVGQFLSSVFMTQPDALLECFIETLRTSTGKKKSVMSALKKQNGGNYDEGPTTQG